MNETVVNQGEHFQPSPAEPPPVSEVGAVGWLRANLFSSIGNTLITLLVAGLLIWFVPGLVSWLFTDAVWGAKPIEACDAARGEGACWAVVAEKFRVMTFGLYPFDEQWRGGLVVIILSLLLVVSAIKWFWNWSLPVIWVLATVITFWLLGGGFGLTPVPVSNWGGLPVTLMLAVFGMVLAFPLGVALALGRRSSLPLIRSFSVIYIEVIRGVPLITVLFMASVMFALFLPEGLRIENLLRAQVAIILFMAAYLAEAVRGGLQAVPKGQYEAAEALGLSYGKAMAFIVLPQALKISIPPIVNSFISLFKDTSLVLIIGIFDFSNAVKRSVETDFVWKKYYLEALLFSIVVYWVYCFAMSRYSQWLEREFSHGHRSAK
ncbi:MAG: amino acid ABC transporter permease [Burkholderiaceae bacterium]